MFPWLHVSLAYLSYGFGLLDLTLGMALTHKPLSPSARTNLQPTKPACSTSNGVPPPQLFTLASLLRLDTPLPHMGTFEFFVSGACTQGVIWDLAGGGEGEKRVLFAFILCLYCRVIQLPCTLEPPECDWQG